MVPQYPWPNSESLKFLKEYVHGKHINLISQWIIMTYFYYVGRVAMDVERIIAYLTETSNFAFFF